jgi:predicted GIY-YIG superfamily endonuclease
VGKNLFKTHKVPQYDRPVRKHRTLNKEPMVIREELDVITKQIKELLIKKKALQRKLKSMGQSDKLPSNYRERPIHLYVLRLEGGYWYVGFSRDVEKRFMRHVRGKGAQWTKLHKPIEVHESRNTKLTSDSEAALLEDELTLEYAREYGPQLVRGGGYCQTKPRWPASVYEPNFDWIKQTLNS